MHIGIIIIMTIQNMCIGFNNVILLQFFLQDCATHNMLEITHVLWCYIVVISICFFAEVVDADANDDYKKDALRLLLLNTLLLVE